MTRGDGAHFMAFVTNELSETYVQVEQNLIRRNFKSKVLAIVRKLNKLYRKDGGDAFSGKK